jgi:hypothetical protein
MDAADHRERLVQVGAELEARARALRARAGEVLRQIATPHTANLSARLADVLAAEEEADRVDRRQVNSNYMSPDTERYFWVHKNAFMKVPRQQLSLAETR